jgi:hypothetical protein
LNENNAIAISNCFYSIYKWCPSIDNLDKQIGWIFICKCSTW